MPALVLVNIRAIVPAMVLKLLLILFVGNHHLNLVLFLLGHLISLREVAAALKSHELALVETSLVRTAVRPLFVVSSKRLVCSIVHLD